MTAKLLLIVRSNIGVTKLWNEEHGGATGFIPRATGIYNGLAAIIVLPVSAGIALYYAVVVMFSKMLIHL